MRNVWNMFWNTVANALGVVDHGVSALNVYAKWAHEEASDFEKTSTMAREHRRAQYQAQLSAPAPVNAE